MSEWFQMLVDIRNRLGISQAELAARAHVSLASVKAYEQGKRHPSRPYLTAILDALKVDRTARNDILDAAGYASDWQELTPITPEVAFNVETAQLEIDRTQWPSFVMTEMSEVIVANRLAERLWGVDLSSEFKEVADRSFLALASNPRFADRCVNWDECVGVIVGVFKGHFRGAEDLGNPSPYFKSMLDRFLQGDPRYVARFLHLWQEVPGRIVELRWHYPVVWEDPIAGRMRFDCIASPANERDGWAFNDWVPVDSASWIALEKMNQSGT